MWISASGCDRGSEDKDALAGALLMFSGMGYITENELTLHFLLKNMIIHLNDT